MRFAKGHGTENDFVLLPDFEDGLALTPALVTRLCDRRAGLGGDGVLRVVLAAAEAAGRGGNGEAGYGGPGYGGPSGGDGGPGHRGPSYGEPGYGLDGRDEPPAEWFMDYRNADGSVAEMCGNGIRVFARYLLDHCLVRDLAFTVGTRSGPRGCGWSRTARSPRRWASRRFSGPGGLSSVGWNTRACGSRWATRILRSSRARRWRAL